MTKHQDIGLGFIHYAHNWEYADSTARTGAGGFVSGDVGKIARQLSDNTFWILTATTPTWVQLGGAAVTFNDAEGDPATIGTAADGTSAYPARRDHVHGGTHAGLTGVSANQHHNQAHTLLSSDHSGNLTQARSHDSPDTDTGTSSLHHTIGAGANQSAAGNHTHTAVGTKRGYTFLIAASDAAASTISSADYACDGTADQSEIATALAALPATGGRIQLSEGTFNISGTITISGDWVELCGVGKGVDAGGTRLKAASGLTTALLKVDNGSRPAAGAFIHDIEIDGNSKYGSSIDGLLLKAYRARVEDLVITGMSGHGLHLQGYSSPSWATYDGAFYGIESGSNGGDGFHLDTRAEDCHWTACIAHDNVGRGMYIDGSSQQVQSLHCYANLSQGVYINGGAARNKFANCKFETNAGGLYIDGTAGGIMQTQIANCNFNSNSRMWPLSYDNIQFNAPNSNWLQNGAVTGNTFADTYGNSYNVRRCINFVGSNVRNNTVMGNTISQNDTTYAPVANGGTNNMVHYNYGWKTEQSGSATVSAGTTSVTVTCSLGSTSQQVAPTRVILTPTSDTGGVRWYVSSKSTTSFVITLNTTFGSNINFDWTAYYGELSY